jgi:hypothetical protein
MSCAHVSFKAHAFGNDPHSPCAEDEVVKMIVEMLIGSTNDIYCHQHKPLHQLYSCDVLSGQSKASVEIYKLTLFGRNLKLNQLSSPLLSHVLEWFAQFGSHVFICRKFAYSQKHKSGTQSLTAAVLETVQSTVADLVTSVDEMLCNLENLILRLPKRTEAETLQMELQPKVTIVSIYQQCYRWASVFRSLAGLVCSTIPSTVVYISTESSAVPEPPLQEAPQISHSAAVGDLYQSLAVRGIMQDLGSSLLQGGLLELPAGTLGSANAHMAGIVSSTGISDEHKCSTSGSCADEYAPEKALALALPPPCVSPLHQYHKLLYTAMCDKYLANLTTIVWQGPTSTVSQVSTGGAGQRGLNSPAALAVSRMQAVLQTARSSGGVSNTNISSTERHGGGALFRRQKRMQQEAFLQQLGRNDYALQCCTHYSKASALFLCYFRPPGERGR